MQPIPGDSTIVQRLAGIEGIVPPASGSPDAGDIGLRSLDGFLARGPLPVGMVIHVGRHLSRALADVHRRGVLHRGIRPSNVVWNEPEQRPLLSGFRQASAFVEGQAEFLHHRDVTDHLRFMAPEQTGRTAHGVDSRTDLYSLGATLYMLSTGRAPIEASDPLQLLHELLVQPAVPPTQWRPELPEALSRAILRLLEKEPARRYQSAEGLHFDLVEIEQGLAAGDSRPLRLGLRDYPSRLSAPSRPVGRRAELRVLRTTLDRAIEGRRRVLLVSGGAGVGKTSLVNELRREVAGRQGLFVSGKFEQFRRDSPGALMQAMGALGRLLLSDASTDLEEQRRRILHGVNGQGGVLAQIPEFALLLGAQPEVPRVSAAQAEARLLSVITSALAATASAARPVVMVLDDLQWAPEAELWFVDSLVDSDRLKGLLLVGVFRDTELAIPGGSAGGPEGGLAGALARWRRRDDRPVQMRLRNLQMSQLRVLLARTMRLPGARASTLAREVWAHTRGNPYETIELLNSLRREGALHAGAGGWTWQSDAVERYVGPHGVAELLARRIGRLPDRARELLRVIACLGGKVHRSMLAVASGAGDAAELDEQLAVVQEEGFVSVDFGEEVAISMRHDRVQQAVHGLMKPRERSDLQLALASRLEAPPARFAEHAQGQYLAASDAIEAPQDCRRVSSLFHEGARRARAAVNHTLEERLLSAAAALLMRLPESTPADRDRLRQVQVGRHVVLCALGRFDEADALFAALEGGGEPVTVWIDAACAQLESWHSRSMADVACRQGVRLLSQVGLHVPGELSTADIERGMLAVAAWARSIEVGRDDRGYTGDAEAEAAGRLIQRLGYPAFYVNPTLWSWLCLQGHELWLAHGPSRELVRVTSDLCELASGRGDYRSGHAIARHALEVSQARGWELEAAGARTAFAVMVCHFFEPLEEVMQHLRVARLSYFRHGALFDASFTFSPVQAIMFDCSPTLDAVQAEIDAGLVLARRIRNDFVMAMLSIDLQLVRALRDWPEPGDPLPDEALTSLARQSHVRSVRSTVHRRDSLLAALFGDAAALVEHARAAGEDPRLQSSYRATRARIMTAYSLALRLQSGISREQGLLDELDRQLRWVGDRAADAPTTLLHLLRWLEAERAWALGERALASLRFDEALHLLDTLSRPWHRAFVTERCGLFHLNAGMARAGRRLLGEARDLFRNWGASGKVRQLEKLHEFLGHGDPVAPQSVEGYDKIDVLALLRASQALSSETSLGRLQTRVGQLMGALGGATAAYLLAWDEERNDWVLHLGPQGEASLTAVEAAKRGLFPLSAMRYVERTREPLVVDDAVQDDRFANDPCLDHGAPCSLLVAPILDQGRLRAILLMENRRRRGAFSAARMEAVMLMAGQLAVSLQNALLYSRLEQRVRVQSRELVAAAQRAGMAQVASNVLHNVGNVLNSVNVSASLLAANLRNSRATRFADVAGVLEMQEGDLARFLALDERGRILPRYMRELAAAAAAERAAMLAELDRLVTSVDHIKNVIAMQQSHAGANRVVEVCPVHEPIEEALRFKQPMLALMAIDVKRDFASVRAAPLDKARLTQIMTNLIDNACHAMEGLAVPGQLRVSVHEEAQQFVVRVSDNGAGIEPEHLDKLFSHGFTTRSDGHGFGLHSCAVAALEMRGSLSAHSDGRGRGATFELRFGAD